MTQGIGYLILPIAIRADDIVRVHLPADITRAEAEKVARVVVAYAPAGTRPQGGDGETGSMRSTSDAVTDAKQPAGVQSGGSE